MSKVRLALKTSLAVAILVLSTSCGDSSGSPTDVMGPHPPATQTLSAANYYVRIAKADVSF